MSTKPGLSSVAYWKEIRGYDAKDRLVYVATPPEHSMYPDEDYIDAAQRYYGAARVEVLCR